MVPRQDIYERPRRVRHIGNTYQLLVPVVDPQPFGPLEELASAHPDIRAAAAADPDARFDVSQLLAGPLTVIGGPPEVPITVQEAQMVALANAEDALAFEHYVLATQTLWRPGQDNPRPWVALHISAWMGLDGLVDRLAGAMPLCVGVAGNLKMTALHWAACNGSLATGQALLSHGADIAALNAFTWSVADIAYHNANAEFERFAVSAGSPPHGSSFRRMLKRYGLAPTASLSGGE